MNLSSKGAAWVGTMVLAAGLCAPAGAQVMPRGNGEGAITSMGTGVLERRPELLRMQVQISADGKDAREAMANLKKLEAAAREKLTKLGASEKGVKLSDAQVAVPGGNDRQQQMERMIRARSGRGPQTKATAAAAPTVHVSARLSAEWALKSQKSDELVVEASELQSKIKAASIVAPPGGATKSAEEEEEAEEGNGNVGMQYEGGPMPGEPVFIYVSKLTDEDRAKIAADAFKKAKAEAARLAKASQSELGALKQLSSSSSDFNRYDPYDYNGQMRQVYAAMQQTGGGDEEEGTDPQVEAIGMQPGKVTYRVVVSASFAIKGQ